MGAVTALCIAYGLGCVSFAALAARLRGVDIRAAGSRNPGATNVRRVMGRGWGLAVLLLDIAKGLVPVLWLRADVHSLFPTLEPAGWIVDREGRVLVLAAAVLGHILPVTSLFHGGKGVATLLGGGLALDPVMALSGVAAHLVVRKLLGYVSVASIVLVWSMPLLQLAGRWLGWSGRFLDGTAVLAAVALLVTIRHRDNFRRIRAGTEDKYDGPASGLPARAV